MCDFGEHGRGAAADFGYLVDAPEIRALIDETRRLTAVGNIDPHALQIIVRQMVTDMLQTDLVPKLQAHAQIQSDIQNTMAPPMPPDGGGNGQMVQ